MLGIDKFITAMLLASTCSYGYSASEQDDFNAFRNQRQQIADEYNAEFQRYKNQQDSEFADFLQSQWREFDTFQGKVRIKEPKPKQIPLVKPSIPKAAPAVPKPTPPDVPPVAVVPPAPVVQPAPIIVPPPPPQPKPKPVSADMIALSFFGNSVSFPFDPAWKRYRLSGGDKPDAMSAFWTMMSDSKYVPTIKAIDKVRQLLKLDDWGHVTLWRDVVRALQPENQISQDLMLWYFLIKSGYDVRLGYSGSDVHLFIAVKQQVYSTKFTNVGNQTYYAVLAADHGDSIRSFYTYEASYPNKLKSLDIHAASTGFTKTVSAKRTLTFNSNGKKIRFNVPYDRRLVEYLSTFPQSEFELYFDTDGSTLMRQSLLAELRKHTVNMSKEEGVNFLLEFVQQAFAYKTDDDQFGYEKYFFVEESLHFPYNDCEDRSVIFAWLVHELLGIKVVGLVYPGHMTTGVAINARSGFSTVDYQGNRFVIADPTYLGASVGMAMPSYEKLQPKRVVEIQY